MKSCVHVHVLSVSQQPPPRTATPEPAKPVVKAPLPAEHVVLQTVLDKLMIQCYERSNNPVSHVDLSTTFVTHGVYNFGFFAAHQKKAGGGEEKVGDIVRQAA